MATDKPPPHLAVDDDAPPGFPAKPEIDDDAPPGFLPKQAVDGLSAQLQSSAKVEEQMDEPDLALRLADGLRERPEAEITTQTDDNTIYRSAQSFEDLGLSPELLKGLYSEMKFERPSKIQATTLPMVLTPPYKDLIAQAHNGSGKTTCFVLAMLSRVQVGVRQPQALCVCPTRELVTQNLGVLARMGKYTNITSTSTASEQEGGGNFRRDPIHEQVVIGTHGKLKAWINKRLLPLNSIHILVFDEADEMLKQDAFGDDSVRMIKNIRRANPAVQLLLFSATFNEMVKRFAMQIAPRANHVFVQKEQLSLDVIQQYNVVCTSRDSKTGVLRSQIFPNCEKLGQTIIFVRSRDTARCLHDELEKEGYKCTSIQGNMDHGDRDKVVQEFRDGTTKILISTDVLSRGFDVSQVTMVINYDVPIERDNRTPAFETYLHRIGRSGRFGRKGYAFNLIYGFEDDQVMAKISSYFNKDIPKIKCDDDEAFEKILADSS